jgi:hypothetical protein
LILTDAVLYYVNPDVPPVSNDKVPAGKYAVSTSNRNFEGRQGPGSRTLLASPFMGCCGSNWSIKDPGFDSLLICKTVLYNINKRQQKHFKLISVVKTKQKWLTINLIFLPVQQFRFLLKM